MKVAICLTGQLRTVRTCAPGILRYFDLLNPDYYFHCWSANTWHMTDSSKRHGHTHEQINIKDIDFVINTFKPILYRIDKNKQFDFDVSQSQQASFMYCNELKKEYEIKHNFKYDIVLKCRFDTIWDPNSQLTISNIEKNTIYFTYIDTVQHKNYPMAMDRVFFGDSETMDKISELYLHTTNLIKNNHNKEMLGPEIGLYKFCQDLNLNIEQTLNHEVLVRRGAEGLHHINDFEKIEELHRNFYKKNMI
jgi:hypothetical protein